jgi:restriction system protein
MAGIVTFGVVLVGLEFLLVIPALVRRSRFQTSGSADIDSLDWSGFEEFIAALFQAKGYRTRLTPTYDQGGDVIADGNEERLVIQTKHSTGGNIGNKGVQQVVAGLGYYQGTRAIVVTNRYFTESAIDLARANNVELWDRDRLSAEAVNTHSSDPSSITSPTRVRGGLFARATSSSATCPRCGATMVLRNSKYGAFGGCSTFPKCWGKRQA